MKRFTYLTESPKNIWNVKFSTAGLVATKGKISQIKHCDMLGSEKKRGELASTITLLERWPLFAPFTCSKYVTTRLVKFDTILESLCGIYKIQMLGVCQGIHAYRPTW